MPAVMAQCCGASDRRLQHVILASYAVVILGGIVAATTIVDADFASPVPAVAPWSPPGALAAVLAMACNESAEGDLNQQWEYNTSWGYFNSRAYLDVDGVLDPWQCRVINKTTVWIFPKRIGTGPCGGVGQQWTFDPTANGSTAITAETGGCLNVDNNSAGRSKLVNTWRCNSGLQSQNFTLTQQGQMRTSNTSGYPARCLTVIPVNQTEAATGGGW